MRRKCNMLRDDAVRLRHMRDAAREAVEFARGRSRADLNRDRMLLLSLVKDIEILGEAAFQIPPSTREELSHIPWGDIIGMRHRLLHAYFDINLDVVWRTVMDDLPALLELLAPVLPGDES